MGGCCSSSRKPPLHGRHIYYYCPPVSGEHEPLASHDSETTALTAGFLIDLNVDTSDPDTFRSPPAPLPFDVVLGCPQSPDMESEAELTSVGKPTSVKPQESYCKSQKNFLLTSSEENTVDLTKSDLPKIQKVEEEDSMIPKIQELSQNVLTIFIFHAYLSGGKEVTTVPYVIRINGRSYHSWHDPESCDVATNLSATQIWSVPACVVVSKIHHQCETVSRIVSLVDAYDAM
ncbi:hypothetical protein LIER_01288 [Lithospermum erythrorhizon]|uniref:Uncharacterized protein n=1 Tax=Lithospermum erythrorhizon TaxID=34254 RepID=A0AAV3NL49_LITER